MRIIVAGMGAVGRHLATMLANGKNEIIAIDLHEDNLNSVQDHADLVTIAGSVTSIGVLKRAEVEHADLFIAVANLESVNITASILAKQMGAKRVIARIDNNDYLRSENSALFKKLGIDTLIYPEKMASQVIINLLDENGTMEYVDFSQGRLSLAVFKVGESMPLIGLSLMEIAQEATDIQYRIVAITRYGETIIPDGEERLHEGDTLHVISDQKGIEQWRKWVGKETSEAERIMVLGASRIGVRTCLDLEGELAEIKLIEGDPQKCHRIDDLFKQTIVLNGDGRDTDFLIEEGIEGMDAFIAVTGSSETNILTCMAARRAGVPYTIAEVENLDYIQLAESLGIDTIVNKKLITASAIFRYTLGGNISSMYCMTGSDAQVLEFVAKDGARITRGPIRGIKFPKQAVVGGVIRGDKAFIVEGSSEILAGDRVIVFTMEACAEKVGTFFA
ncbi:MAG: Trk system potassium transporter TrkA [Bacteroidia bacterium]|nr:MAG: Trk system potassium transporter TrkA [Bacteroidia bacterium]